MIWVSIPCVVFKLPANVRQRYYNKCTPCPFPTLKWCERVYLNTTEREGGPPKYTALLDEIEQDLAGTVLASFQDPTLWFGNETQDTCNVNYLHIFTSHVGVTLQSKGEWPQAWEEDQKGGRINYLKEQEDKQRHQTQREIELHYVHFYFYVKSLEFLWRALTIKPAN